MQILGARLLASDFCDELLCLSDPALRVKRGLPDSCLALVGKHAIDVIRIGCFLRRLAVYNGQEILKDVRTSALDLFGPPQKTLTPEELLMILDILDRHKIHASCDLIDLQVLAGGDLFDVLLQHEVINDGPGALVVRRFQTNQFTAYCVIALLLHETDYLR